MKREDIVKTINSLKGESGHKKVLDVYNGQCPLPRGYKVKPTDAWCAITVSAVFIMNGYPDFAECSCPEMIKKAQKLGIWQEDDGYTPKPGDVVMYDWQDSGKGDDTGVADHTGIVISVSKSKVTVREGNKNKTIGNRDITVNGVNIRGFILPKFDEEDAPVVNSTPKKEKAQDLPNRHVYEAGKTYTICASALNVRTGAGLQYKKVAYKNLTPDGKKHAVGSALRKGTRVTCNKIQTEHNNVWMKIPSGWICAELNGTIYVK